MYNIIKRFAKEIKTYIFLLEEGIKMKFEIKGTVLVKDILQKFSKTVEAKSENHAKDVLYALLGSNYKVTRKNISIESVKEVKNGSSK